jgi:hypothetical protein
MALPKMATGNDARAALMMNNRRMNFRGGLIQWTLAASLLALGCGSGGDPSGADSPNIEAERRADGTIIDDKALCDFNAKQGLEVSETAGPGAYQPNVRRVWKVFGTGGDRRKVLACREVDTNLDGLKDTVRFYNDEGQSKEERADTNYDGKIDTWNLFAKGRLAEVRLDKNHDGKADEWKEYYQGKLSKVRRDTDYNGKANVWEMYRKGRLERMGVDLDGDERVDRWDHDSDARREQEKAQRDKDKKDEEKKDAEGDGDGGGDGDSGDKEEG